MVIYFNSSCCSSIFIQHYTFNLYFCHNLFCIKERKCLTGELVEFIIWNNKSTKKLTLDVCTVCLDWPYWFYLIEYSLYSLLSIQASIVTFFFLALLLFQLMDSNSPAKHYK